MLTSKICNASDFHSSWFLKWRSLMQAYTRYGIPFGGNFLHRKEWEFVVILQALAERGLLAKNRRGLGFGVGRELLPAVFAKHGCQILATDKIDDSGGAWQDHWPADREALAYPEICSRDCFDSNVSFERIDMHAIPRTLTDYDFSWSCSSLEHLGSLHNGVEFLLRQMDCLKPGSWAVHTTEFNLFSNHQTVRAARTVLYRKRDIEFLEAELSRRGHRLAPVDFNRGCEIEDWFVAHPPFDDARKNLAHLRTLLGPYICTSLLLIIQKAL
jgi:hypothetical protein